MAVQRYLMAYDIAAHSSRCKALHLLRKHADCYQNSVFELQLRQTELQPLLDQLYPLFKSGDALLTVKLQVTSSWQLGTGLLPIYGALAVFS